MIDGILMIVIGAIAAMSIVTKMVKDSEKLLSKIVPFQGYLGIVALIWGIWTLIGCITSLGTIGTWPLWWITRLGIGLVETVIGFMLGFGLLSKYVLSKNEAAKKKAEELLAKLAGYQSNIGVIGIIVGVWTILYSLILQNILKI